MASSIALLLLALLPCSAIATPTLIIARKPFDGATAALARSLQSRESSIGVPVSDIDFHTSNPPLPSSQLNLLSLPAIKLALSNTTVLPVRIDSAPSVSSAVSRFLSFPHDEHTSSAPVVRLHSCAEIERLPSTPGVDTSLVELVDNKAESSISSSTAVLSSYFDELAHSSAISTNTVYARAYVDNLHSCVRRILGDVNSLEEGDTTQTALLALSAGRAPEVFRKSRLRASELRSWARAAMVPLVPRAKRQELFQSARLDELALFVNRFSSSSLDVSMSEAWLMSLRGSRCTCVSELNALRDRAHQSSQATALSDHENSVAGSLDGSNDLCSTSPPALRCVHVELSGGDEHALKALGLQDSEPPLAAVLDHYSGMAFPLRRLPMFPSPDDFIGEIGAYFGELIPAVQRNSPSFGVSKQMDSIADESKASQSSSVLESLTAVPFSDTLTRGLCVGSTNHQSVQNSLSNKVRSQQAQAMHVSAHDVAATLQWRGTTVVTLLCMRAAGVCQRAQVAFEFAGTEVVARAGELGKSQCERTAVPMMAQIECTASHCGEPVLPINGSVSLPAILAFHTHNGGNAVAAAHHKGPMQSSHIAEFMRRFATV